MKDQMLKLNPKSNAKNSIALDHTQIKVFREKLHEFDIVSNKKNPNFKKDGNKQKAAYRASWNYNSSFGNTDNGVKVKSSTINNKFEIPSSSNIKSKFKPIEVKKGLNKELSKIALISTGIQSKNTAFRLNSRNNNPQNNLNKSNSVKKDELKFLNFDEANKPSSNNYRFKRNVESIVPRRFNTISADFNDDVDIITNKAQNTISQSTTNNANQRNNNNNPFIKNSKTSNPYNTIDNSRNNYSETLITATSTIKENSSKENQTYMKVVSNKNISDNRISENKLSKINNDDMTIKVQPSKNLMKGLKTERKEGEQANTANLIYRNNIRAIKHNFTENLNQGVERNSKSFFFFNETIKSSQEKNKVEKLVNREIISNKVYEKIDKITKFSEKERLISKIQSQTNNILLCKADYMKIQAEKASKELEKRQEKVIDMNLKLSNKLEKEKYYSMNDKVIKTIEQSTNIDSKPKVLFIGSLKKCMDPLLSLKSS